MFKTAVACLAAIMLCSGCILTKEDLDCWYDDMCLTLAPTIEPTSANLPAIAE